MKRILTAGVVATVLWILVTGSAWAAPLATIQTSPASLDWQPVLSDAGLTLTVSGPESFYLRQDFAPGQSPSFSVYDEGGNLRPAGVYVWELRAVHTLDEGIRQELEGARQSGDEGALQKSSKLPAGPTYQSGSFSILDGAIVAGGLEEPARQAGGPVLATKVVHTEGVCAGFDCPASPAFGDSTILMMENNTRIKFGDTSASPFPNGDWEIEANSSVSGGLSYLGFNDCGTADNDGGCATDLVFAVEAGARQNALYVEGDGDVGVGTANPVLDLHIVTGNTPALRLEQDGSSGFTAQTWDLAGNETNFFVRDVTSGSTLPFRIFPGAASSSLVIDDTDNVGIGTVSPDAALDIERAGAGSAVSFLRFTNTSGPGRLEFRDNTGAVDWDFRTTSGDTFVITQPTSPTNDFQIASNGNVTVRGTLTTSGPTCGAGCDRVFAPDFELESIEEHAASMWANSYLPAVGPTRPGEAFNVSEKTGGILNELEKAHIYIEQLHGTIRELEAKAGEKDELLVAVQERLARVEAALAER